MRASSHLISRSRRVKCDGVRPVCGQCMKAHRQCLGFGSPNRLILKDETQIVIKRLRKRCNGSSTEEEFCASSSSNADSPPPSAEHEKSVSGCRQVIQYTHVNNPLEWFPGSKIRMTPAYEQYQVALSCCRDTINLRTLSWIMSDEKWMDHLPEMMGCSDALTSVIYANASTYLAKMAGAISVPPQALRYYEKALKALQRDLYSPVRQTRDETLFAIILLGVFDVCINYGSS
jgi:hypothetical protein